MFSCLCDNIPCRCPKVSYAIPPSPLREERLIAAGIGIDEPDVIWENAWPNRLPTNKIRIESNRLMLEGMTKNFVDGIFGTMLG